MRPTALAALSAILMLLSCRPVRQASTDTVHTSPVKEPADYFFMHRATPGETFSHRTYVQAFEDARALWQEKSGFPGFCRSGRFVPALWRRPRWRADDALPFVRTGPVIVFEDSGHNDPAGSL